MKTMILEDTEVQRVQAIVLDKDRDEALRFLTDVVWERLKEKPGHACGPKPV